MNTRTDLTKTPDNQLAQELAALRHTVAALVQAMGTRLTREQMCARRGCHRNTLAGLIERETVPRPDAHGKFLLSEVLDYEAVERQKRAI